MDTFASEIPDSVQEPAYAFDDTFSKVMGHDKNGRVRGLGLGVCPSNVFGSSYRVGRVVTRDIRQEEIDKMRAEMEQEMQTQIAAQVSSQVSAIKTQLVATMKDEMRAEMEQEMQTQVAAQVSTQVSTIKAQLEAKMKENTMSHIRTVMLSMQSSQDVSSRTGQVKFYSFHCRNLKFFYTISTHYLHRATSNRFLMNQAVVEWYHHLIQYIRVICSMCHEFHQEKNFKVQPIPKKQQPQDQGNMQHVLSVSPSKRSTPQIEVSQHKKVKKNFVTFKNLQSRMQE